MLLVQVLLRLCDLKIIQRHLFLKKWDLSSSDKHKHRLTEALSKGGFPLAQWATSCDLLRPTLPNLDGSPTILNMDLDEASVERDFQPCCPADCPAQLIVADVHVCRTHGSTDRTHHDLRPQYWIPKGRQAVRRIVGKCNLCKRYNVKPTPLLMAALPSYRLQPGLPAFAHTGVDYFGPIEVVMLRRRMKRWGCLFTCLNSRAVHMEVA